MARISIPDIDAIGGEDRVWIERLREGRGQRPANLFRILCHRPEGANALSNVGLFLRRSGLLPAAVRETAILATSSVRRCQYEWTAHVPAAREAGVDADTIGRLAERTAQGIGDPRLAAVAAYALEVVSRGDASDEAFAVLRRHFDEREIAEITLTIGYYDMLACVLNGLRVELDAGRTPLPFARPAD